MQSNKIFEFLKKVQLDSPLDIYLSRLLVIDPTLTVDYMLQRFGKTQLQKIVE